MKRRYETLRARAAAWRLPVRIPVPNRDNLIAMGLMALAFGLMVGVAIGPALGAASNAVAGVVAPLAAAPPPAETEDTTLTDTADGVTLGSPAGSAVASSTTSTDSSGRPGDGGGSSGFGSGSGYASTDTPETDDGVNEEPAKIPSEPETPEPEPEEPVEGTELKGVVVGVDRGETGYDVADSSGNVLALHASEPPAVGESVVTRIEPLANGTFGEVGAPKAAGLKTKTKLRGTVSWIDPVTKIAVLSSRGSSLAVDLGRLPESESAAIPLGGPAEAVVLLGAPVTAEDGSVRPGLIAESLKVTGDPLESFDLNGVIRETGAGPSGRQLSVSIDGAGIVALDLAVDTQEDFDPAVVTPGKTYNLSVELRPDGTLRLTGLSADYSRKVAGDTAGAYGTHA